MVILPDLRFIKEVIVCRERGTGKLLSGQIYIYMYCVWGLGEPYPVDILYPSCFLNINETDMSNKANKFDFY